MTSLSQAWTIVLQFIYANRRDFNKLMDYSFWPLLDIIIYGFIGVGFTAGRHDASLAAFMTAMLLWQVVHRTSLEISRNFLHEITDNNVINLLSTPLSVPEWLMGLMLVGGISLCFTVPFGGLMIWYIYGYNVFSLGIYLVPFIILLAISGWILGLLGSGFLLWRGRRIDTMVWALGWLPAPFCSVYYPLEVLPYWAQVVGKCLPMTYVFKALRSLVLKNSLSVSDIALCILLNAFYLILASLFFNSMLRRRKEIGLSNL